MDLKGRLVFVTGAAGFIGARLVKSLVSDLGAKVRVLVRNGSPGGLWLARLGVDIVEGNVLDGNLMKKSIQGCDAVFHLAYGNRGSPTEQRYDTVMGTKSVAEACLLSKSRILVNVGTAAVYAGSGSGLVDETVECRPWGWHYADSKLEAEQLLMTLHRERSLPVVNVQVAGVYGPWGATFTVNPLLQLRKGPVILVGAGEGLVNATFVDDAVQGIVLAALADAIGETFIITGPDKVTRRQLYETYEEMLGLKERLVGMTAHEINAVMGRGVASSADRGLYENATFPDPDMLDFLQLRMELSHRKASASLGYTPRYSLQQGMERTREWASWARLLTTP